MKKYFPQIILAFITASTLSACGGSSHHGHENFMPQEEIPPLEVQDKSIGHGEQDVYKFQ